MGMTELEVKQYCESIKILTEKRNKKQEQIEELRSVATNCVVSMDKDPVQTSGSGDKMANLVTRMIDLIVEVGECDEIIERRIEFLKMVGQELSNIRHQTYLRLRYIEQNSFYDTVVRMDLSDSTARRVDKRMISELTKIINDRTTISSRKSN